ncbi:host specificity factor TipJ family phage tail protein [Xylophilus sp. GOD-11R]|uniref:host specificity factor TipJ family phage tail protein n=1 Tax=Xylophilus sp. GOD-11R TaxID=3089814 RepID=UPI00298BFDB5|nr:host specificity factor TipJ family phage tail protein [Xylophilus sp. GOD-11R]WPB58650.1 host specificity factor TipJ family phage tail protein [Xylophilus sp. GOD-11R]
MLTILNDPAGLTGRQRHEWDFDITVQANIERHLRSGGGCKVLALGIEIDPLVDPLLDRHPTVVDSVTVVRRPEGLEALAYLVIAAIAAVAVTYALMPKVATSASGKDSPNNQLTGQTNVARAYQAIPDVYGYRRVWPDLIQPSTVEYIDHIKYVTEWMCISRGKGAITAVNYAETPIGDIAGASYEVFSPVATSGYPEFGQTTLLDVLETFASDEVNGQELVPSAAYAPVMRSSSVSYDTVQGQPGITITLPDGADLAQLKSLAPTGFAAVAFAAGEESRTFYGKLSGFNTNGGGCALHFESGPQAATASFGAGSVTITPDATTITVAGPYTLPVTGSRIRWNTVFLRGLRGSVTIRAEWWQVDNGGAELPGTRQSQNNTYTAKTYDQRFYTTDVIPAAGTGRYRIQFTRTSAVIGDGSFDVAKLEELYAVRHYPAKVLPGVTVIRVTTKATEDATGYSDRKFNLRWLRHVRALSNDTLGPSRNFARAMAHIWTISGNRIAELDTARLAAINAEFGEEHPLLRFDASLDDADMSLGDRLQLAADAARCVLWRDGQKWTVTRDQRRSYPELQLDYRNLAAGGESAISYAAHLPASNDGVEVEYIDELSQAKKAYIRLSIASGAVVSMEAGNPKKVKLAACTTAAQANNRGQFEARRLLYQRVSVTDTAMSDSGTLGIGSLVRWIDPNDFAGDDGLQAGEVLAIKGNFIATSEPLDWKGEPDGRILFTGPDGRHLGAPIRCLPVVHANGAIVPDFVELTNVPDGLYVADGERQLGSRYAFAVGLTDAEVESAGLFLTTSIKPDSATSAVLALAEYDERIYAGD